MQDIYPMCDGEKHLLKGRSKARGFIVAFYLIAGVFHISAPNVLLPIVPDWVPFPRDVILGTGVCEIAGAIALLTRGLRRVAGIALALYAICVLPANVHHAIIYVRAGGSQVGWWYHAPRLAFQPVLVWWALFAGEVIDWPFACVRLSRPEARV